MWVKWTACAIHLSQTNTDVIVGLFLNSSKYICVSVDFILFFSCEEYQVVSHSNTDYFPLEISIIDFKTTRYNLFSVRMYEYITISIENI